jgi:hypothetical protein
MTMDEGSIRSVVRRLSRQHPSGGQVIERAAVVAEGADSGAILAWITDHDGRPEARAPMKSRGGLHRARLAGDNGMGSGAPQRYVLPPDALAEASPAPRAAEPADRP